MAFGVDDVESGEAGQLTGERHHHDRGAGRGEPQAPGGRREQDRRDRGERGRRQHDARARRED